jgi:predicted nucleic acid-binding protein
MSDNVIFDSNILINLLNNRIDSRAFWETFRKYKRYISVITEIEVLSDWKLSEDESLELRIFLNREFRCIPLSRGIKAETIRFRQRCRRKLPDSLIAAAAVIHGLTLISNDAHLLEAAYPGLAVKPFALKPPVP